MDFGAALGILAGLVGTVGFGAVGVTMAATTHGEFRLARYCFWAFAILGISSIVGLQLAYEWGQPEMKVAINAIAAALVVGLATAGLDWVKKKEQTVVPKVAPAASPPGSSPGIIGNEGIITKDQKGDNVILKR